MDIIPAESAVTSPSSFHPASRPPWSRSPRSPVQTPRGECEPSTPRTSAESPPPTASQHDITKRIVTETVKEFETRISALASLAADLPSRFGVSDDQRLQCDSANLVRWQPYQVKPRNSKNSAIEEDAVGVEHRTSFMSEGEASSETGSSAETRKFGHQTSKTFSFSTLSEDGESQEGDDAILEVTPTGSPQHAFRNGKARRALSVASALSEEGESQEGDNITLEVPVSTCSSRSWRVHNSSQQLRNSLPQHWALFVRPKEMTNVVWNIPKITERSEYEICIGAVILANTVYMGVELQYAGDHLGKELDPSQIGSITFLTIYCIDLLARLWCEGWQFFYGPEIRWNALDSVVVITALVEQFLRIFGAEGSLQSLLVLRTLRLLRLARILRIGRFLKNFKEFRLLMYSLQRALGALLWTIVLCSLTVYMFALAVAQGSLEYCDASTVGSSSCMAFGRLSDATMSMYKTMFGGIMWGELLDLLSPFGTIYQGIYLFYIAFNTTIILNLATGVVLDIVQDTVRGEKDVVIDNYLREKVEYVQMMHSIFDELDVDGSGGICKEELEYATKNIRMSAWLESIGLDISDVEDLFHILDRERTGAIDIEQFVLGCMRLRGGAKTVDVMKLQLRAEWMVMNVESLQKRIDKVLHQYADIGSSMSPDSLTKDKASPARQTALTVEPTYGRFTEILTEESFLRWQVIEVAEARAMTLNDLRTTLRFAKIQCANHEWPNPLDEGKALQPNKVNLYHFNHHCISPYTVPNGVLLHGLQVAAHHRGSSIIQRNPGGRSTDVLAAGLVLDVSEEDVVHVKTTVGRFREAGGDQTSSETCILIGDEAVGMPSKIEKTVSLSWKELTFPVPTKPRWFCSHWWGEPISDFVACCERHATLHKMQNAEATYWVCAYANRQHDLAGDISSDPDKSSFRKAMQVADGTLLLLDGDATPFRRIWCDFELYHTISDEKPLDIVTVTGTNGPQLLTQDLMRNETSYDKLRREETFPLSLLVVGLKTRLEDGDASVQSDKKAILRSMARNKRTGKQGDAAALALALKTANAKLHSYLAMAAWPQALKRGRVDNFDMAGSLSLPVILSDDDSMEAMVMSFAHMDEMTDKAVEQVAAGVPRKISRLQLSFEGCGDITDQGMVAVAQNLPAGLEVLFLNFVGCPNITDAALTTLAQQLPSNLKELRLDFAHCEKLGFDGVQALGAGLPANLKRFAATFQGTMVDRKFQTVKELQRFGRQRTRSCSSSSIDSDKPISQSSFRRSRAL